MSLEKIKQLLDQLQAEISQSTDTLDEKTAQQLQKLGTDVNQLIGNKDLQQQDIYEGISRLEYDFLNEHPMAANLMRGIVDLLSKAGI